MTGKRLCGIDLNRRICFRREEKEVGFSRAGPVSPGDRYGKDAAAGGGRFRDNTIVRLMN